MTIMKKIKKDQRYLIRQSLKANYHVIWSKHLPGIYAVIPREKNMAFGRNIYDMQGNILGCDLPKAEITTIPPQEYENRIEIPDGILVYLYWYKDKWFIASNIYGRTYVNSNTYLPTTNRNIIVSLPKQKKTIIETCGKIFTNYPLDTFCKEHTHMFIIYDPACICYYIQGNQQKIRYCCSINNETGEVVAINNSPLDMKIMGTYYITKSGKCIVYDSGWYERAKILGRATNIFYIAIRALKYEEKFKEYFAEWIPILNDVKDVLRKNATQCIAHFTDIGGRKCPERFMPVCYLLHECCATSNIEVDEVFSMIINHFPPEYIAQLLRIPMNV
jgi:hypothetical protein